MMKCKLFTYLCCSAILFLFLSGTALAHKVMVFAWVEGDTIFGETKFSGGKKAQKAQIIVRDTDGNELLQTQTDKKGEFSFLIPKKCTMLIELSAGMGHKGEWTIPVEEITGNITPGNSAPDKKTKEPEVSSLQDETPKPGITGIPAISKAELAALIEQSVEKSLNKKITPLMKSVADLNQAEPSLSDIIGGIGYIFGLMGVAMYFKSRQQSKG